MAFYKSAICDCPSVLASNVNIERHAVCAECLVGIDEVLLRGLGVGLDGLGAGLPVGGTHLAVLVRVLEGLHQAEGLLHGPGQHIIYLDDKASNYLFYSRKGGSGCKCLTTFVLKTKITNHFWYYILH